MTVVWFDDARAFQQQVTPFLLAAEAENNLLLGLIDKLARRWPERCLYNSQPAVMAGPNCRMMDRSKVKSASPTATASHSSHVVQNLLQKPASSPLVFGTSPKIHPTQ